MFNFQLMFLGILFMILSLVVIVWFGLEYLYQWPVSQPMILLILIYIVVATVSFAIARRAKNPKLSTV